MENFFFNMACSLWEKGDKGVFKDFLLEGLRHKFPDINMDEMKSFLDDCLVADVSFKELLVHLKVFAVVQEALAESAARGETSGLSLQCHPKVFQCFFLSVEAKLSLVGADMWNRAKSAYWSMLEDPTTYVLGRNLYAWIVNDSGKKLLEAA